MVPNLNESSSSLFLKSAFKPSKKASAARRASLSTNTLPANTPSSSLPQENSPLLYESSSSNVLEFACFVIPLMLQSTYDEIGEVTGKRKSTPQRLQLTAATSIRCRL